MDRQTADNGLVLSDGVVTAAGMNLPGCSGGDVALLRHTLLLGGGGAGADVRRLCCSDDDGGLAVSSATGFQKGICLYVVAGTAGTADDSAFAFMGVVTDEISMLLLSLLLLLFKL